MFTFLWISKKRNKIWFDFITELAYQNDIWCSLLLFEACKIDTCIINIMSYVGILGFEDVNSVNIWFLVLVVIGLDVKDELQQAEGNQQTHSAGSLGFGEVAPGPQPVGVYPPRRLSGAYLPAPASAGRQPASAAAPSHLHHLHFDGILPRLHAEAPLPFRQWADVNVLGACGHYAAAGKSVPPWKPMDMWLQHEVAPWLG